MNLTNLEELRKRTLAEVEKEFVEELVPAELTVTEENGVSVLNVLMSGSDEKTGNASGEFFFLPSEPGDEIQYFVNLITLYEEIPEENLQELNAAVAAINTYVTCGGFGVDPGANSLIYKLVYPMSAEAGEDAVRENVDLSMGCAFQAFSDFGYLLTEVCEGERSAQSAIGVLADEI